MYIYYNQSIFHRIATRQDSPSFPFVSMFVRFSISALEGEDVAPPLCPSIFSPKRRVSLLASNCTLLLLALSSPPHRFSPFFRHTKMPAVDEPSHQTIMNYPMFHIPTLTSKNWLEWETRIFNSLRLHPVALDIMTGKISEKSAAYSSKLDAELLSLIDRKVHSDIYGIVLSVDTARFPKGSLVYNALKACLGPRVQEQVMNAMRSFRQAKKETLPSYHLRATQFHAKASRAGLLQSEREQEEWVMIVGQGHRNPNERSRWAATIGYSKAETWEDLADIFNNMSM
jgi:hypothetical protein